MNDWTASRPWLSGQSARLGGRGASDPRDLWGALPAGGSRREYFPSAKTQRTGANRSRLPICVRLAFTKNGQNNAENPVKSGLNNFYRPLFGP